MAKRRFLRSAAVGFGIGLFTTAALLLTKKMNRQPEAKHAEAKHDDPAPDQPEAAPQPFNQLPDPGAETQKAGRPDERTKTQKKKRKWNWLAIQTIATFLLGLATLGVLVYHGVIFSKQQESAQKQLDVARKQFEATDRPWLSVDAVPNGPFVFRSLGAGLNVKFTVKNVGRSVANDAIVISDVFLSKTNEDVYGNAIERQRQICEDTTTTITTRTVFPNDTFTDGQVLIAEIPTIEKVRSPGSNELPFFLIIGCVKYRFGDQPIRHHTYFIYEVVGSDHHPIQIGQDIPEGGVLFFKSSYGGNDAD